MIWIKHLCNAKRDPFIRMLREKMGHQGYSMWWMLLETIGEQMKAGSNRCHLEMSVSSWCNELDCRPKSFFKFIECIASKENIEVQVWNPVDKECYRVGVLRGSDGFDNRYLPDRKRLGNDYLTVTQRLRNDYKYMIKVPKLLELRDTRNSNRGSRGTIEVEVEVDKDIKEKDKKEKGKKENQKPTDPYEPKKADRPYAYKVKVEIPAELVTNKIPEPFLEILNEKAYGDHKVKMVYANEFWEKFAMWWASSGNKKKDWYATFRNWCMNDKSKAFLENPNVLCKVGDFEYYG